MGPCNVAFKAASQFVRQQCHKIKQPFFRQPQTIREPDPLPNGEASFEHVGLSMRTGPWPEVMLDSQLTEEVKSTILQRRKLQVEEANAVALIKLLDRKILELHKAMLPIEKKIGEAKYGDQESQSDIAKWEQQLAPMKERHSELEAQQESLRGDIVDIHERQRQSMASAFEMLDPFFVYNRLIDRFDQTPSPEFLSTIHELEESATIPVEQDFIPPEDPGDASSPPNTPQVEDEGGLAEHQGTPNTADATPEVDPKEVLKYDYQTAKAILSGAEHDFECRYENFQEGRAQFEQQMAEKGKKIGPKLRLRMDMHELDETRRLAQALEDAERDLARAKEACLAADVDIAGSDCSSGFIDDVEDGYRISEEKEIVESVNTDRIHNWLSQIPDFSDAEPDVVQQPSDDVEVDDWDTQSVDIEDSCSMVAEGSARRRIDKWFDMCQIGAVEKEWYSQIEDDVLQ